MYEERRNGPQEPWKEISEDSSPRTSARTPPYPNPPGAVASSEARQQDHADLLEYIEQMQKAVERALAEAEQASFDIERLEIDFREQKSRAKRIWAGVGMMAAFLLALAVLLSVGQLGVAQTGENGGSSKAESPSGAANVRAGTKINAQLESAVDARTAKPGQEVTARVTKDVKQDGRVVLRKGDHLLGRVTSVEASDKASAGSHLSVDFDRVVRGQTTSQLNAAITSVLSARGETASEEPMPAEPTMTVSPPSRGSSPAAGGDGSGEGLVGGLTSTVGSTAGVAGSAAGNLGVALDATGQAPAGTAAGAAANPIRVESRGQADQEAGLGSMLSTRQGDLRLESGTRMQFEVVAQREGQSQK